MATWTPDPTFYPSPRIALKAPPETFAYVAAFDPDRRTPDTIAVGCGPAIAGLYADCRNDCDAECRR
jgi:hypothetical protein